MTPDLSAAFLRCKDFLTSPGFVDAENASPECVADLLLIAREWAKTYREDDDDRPTKEWAEQVGASAVDIDERLAEMFSFPDTAVSGDMPPFFKTKRHVRLFYAAIGIPLKEDRP